MTAEDAELETAGADTITVRSGSEGRCAEGSTNVGPAGVRPAAARRCCERGKKIMEELPIAT